MAYFSCPGAEIWTKDVSMCMCIAIFTEKLPHRSQHQTVRAKPS